MKNRLISGGICLVGMIVMLVALSSHSWIGGKLGWAEIEGGLISAESNRSSYDEPTPWSRWDPSSGVSGMFRGAGMCTSVFGGFSIFMFFFFLLLALPGVSIVPVPLSQQLTFGLFDIKDKKLLVRFHPARTATGNGVVTCLWAGWYIHMAPEGLELGWALPTLVIGLVIASVGAYAIDRRALLSKFVPGKGALAPTPDGLPAGDGLPCVRCEGPTKLNEKAARYRCLKCGLYQPVEGLREPAES